MGKLTVTLFDIINQILGRVSTHLEKSNTVMGTYMCQGKMPLNVSVRVETMADADKVRPMIENFDHALSHPDTCNLNQLGNIVAELTKSVIKS